MLQIVLLFMNPEMTQIAHWQVDPKSHLSSHHNESHVPAEDPNNKQHCPTSLSDSQPSTIIASQDFPETGYVPFASALP